MKERVYIKAVPNPGLLVTGGSGDTISAATRPHQTFLPSRATRSHRRQTRHLGHGQWWWALHRRGSTSFHGEQRILWWRRGCLPTNWWPGSSPTFLAPPAMAFTRCGPRFGLVLIRTGLGTQLWKACCRGGPMATMVGMVDQLG